MYRFFIDAAQINTAEKKAVITGPDRNHIKNVLRMREGEEVSLMIPGDENEYRCAVSGYTDETVELDLLFVKESNVELPCEVVLYQALPKADKMEYVITKSVELGVSRIVPVASARSIVKLDGSRQDKKIARWNTISETAAKQSKRAVIPQVTPVMTMQEAIEDCSTFDTRIIPYELADPDSMNETRKIIGSIRPGSRVAVFIGPEGGFTDEEIALATAAGIIPVTLGHRILRTETAPLVVLSWISYNIEK
ncbi:MAG: 16S rRNA (uracil(1498)-N(3))-methyltransferase [Lachnospiraceae bacterium]|nr:16S rRNA (uracil(1498)-N(3))-methyltransferase [Lachnospiraceae bacterium]